LPGGTGEDAPLSGLARRAAEALFDVRQERPAVPAARRHRFRAFDHGRRVGAFRRHFAEDRPAAGPPQDPFGFFDGGGVACLNRLCPVVEPLTGTDSEVRRKGDDF
jgi:hypothetical protein